MTRLYFDVEKVEFIDGEKVDSNQFALARIHAFSSGDNLHDLHCDVETLKRTAPTIFEKPIVFDFDEAWYDFKGHNDDGTPFIAGFVVPNSAEFFELEDGRVGLSVLAKIWKMYSRKFLDAFQLDDTTERKVSVEMELKKTEPDEKRGGFSRMVDFAYTAIAVLGKYVTEASPGAHLQMLTFSSERDKENFFERFSKYEDIDFTIPKAVRENARTGLELRKKFGRGGTSVSLSVAKYLDKNSIIPPQKVRQISRYFEKNSTIDLSDKESNDWINWLLWGGNAGKAWSSKLIKFMKEEDERLSVYFQEETMPYKNIEEVNPAIKGITPPVTLAQANEIAKQAESIGVSEEKNGWAIAISNFKKNHTVKDGKWVKKETKQMSGNEIADSDGKEEERILMAEEEIKEGEETFAEEEKPNSEEEEAQEETTETEEMQAEEGDETEEDDSEGEESEEGEQEEMAQNSYERVGEILSMLEGEDGYDELYSNYQSGSANMTVLMDAVLGKMQKMANEAKVHMEELGQLRSYKSDIEEKQFSLEVNSTLKEIEAYVPKDEIESLRSDSENFSLGTIDGWKNKVRARAFEFTKNRPEETNENRYEAFPVARVVKSDSIWE